MKQKEGRIVEGRRKSAKRGLLRRDADCSNLGLDHIHTSLTIRSLCINVVAKGGMDWEFKLADANYYI